MVTTRVTSLRKPVFLFFFVSTCITRCVFCMFVCIFIMCNVLIGTFFVVTYVFLFPKYLFNRIVFHVEFIAFFKVHIKTKVKIKNITKSKKIKNKNIKKK